MKPTTIDRVLLTEWIVNCAQKMRVHRDWLTALDAAIGDADHGVNMERGFDEVGARLAGYGGEECGALCKLVGMTLLAKVGGASGPLYGTFFLRMGLVAAGKQQLTESEFAAAFAGGVDGIRQRGSARLGDKTMVDALLPAALALQQALDNYHPLCAALRSAAAAAETGMRATIPMQASKGRASYLGPRSVGHQDPGATSAWLLVLSAAEVVCLAAAPGGLFQQDKQREEAEGWEN